MEKRTTPLNYNCEKWLSWKASHPPVFNLNTHQKNKSQWVLILTVLTTSWTYGVCIHGAPKKFRTNPCMCPQQGLSAVNGNNAGGHLSLQDHQSGVICEVAMRRGQMFIGQPWSAPWPVVVHHTDCLFADIGGAKHAKHRLCMPAQVWELHFVEWAIKAVQCGGTELLIESEIAVDVNRFKLHIRGRLPAIQWKGSGHQLQFWFIPLRVGETTIVGVCQSSGVSKLVHFTYIPQKDCDLSSKLLHTHQNNLAVVESSGPGQTHKFMIQVQRGVTQGFFCEWCSVGKSKLSWDCPSFTWFSILRCSYCWGSEIDLWSHSVSMDGWIFPKVLFRRGDTPELSHSSISWKEIPLISNSSLKICSWTVSLISVLRSKQRKNTWSQQLSSAVHQTSIHHFRTPGSGPSRQTHIFRLNFPVRAEDASSLNHAVFSKAHPLRMTCCVWLAFFPLSFVDIVGPVGWKINVWCRSLTFAAPICSLRNFSRGVISTSSAFWIWNWNIQKIKEGRTPCWIIQLQISCKRQFQ